MMADDELRTVRAAQADPQAFTPLYTGYHATIFRFLFRRVGQRELAADLTQQTFLKALVALPRFEPRGLPFRAWLYRIALNELRMHWRKKKETIMDLSWAEVRELRTETGLPETEEDIQRLATALSRLPEEKARLIELRYIDGMSFVEVGQVLGIAEDAAKMRVHRVLATLRQYLGSRS
jgi:RNA polymerase sigma-70 factor, ECF subfamily